MPIMRVAIRFSLDSEQGNHLRSYVEGRLNAMPWTPSPPQRPGTGAIEGYIQMGDFERFGVELGALFKWLEHERKKPKERLDHFWMHCDVVDDLPRASPLPVSAAHP